MRVSIVCFVCFVCFGIVSCSKKKSISDSTPVGYPDYAKLSIGNYWVYQEFFVDSFGSSTPTSIYDSMYVEKDTTINGDTFFKLVSINSASPYNKISFQRVVNERIENEENRILFSSTNFNEPTYSTFIMGPDTIGEYIERMVDRDQSIVVPAGTFVTSNMQYQYLFRPDYPANGKIRYQQNRYAQQIGLVEQTLPFYSNDPLYKIKRLVRYHLN